MKILFLTHYALLYGANRSLLSLVENFAARGVQVWVWIGEKGDLGEYLQARKIPFWEKDFPISMHYAPENEAFWKKKARFVFNKFKILEKKHKQKKAISWALETIKKEKIEFDFIYSNSTVFEVGTILAQKLRLPHVQHLREFGYDDYFLKPDAGLDAHFKRLAAAQIKICISKAIETHYFGTLSPELRQKNAIFQIYNGVLSKEEGLKREKLKKQNDLQNKAEANKTATFLFIGLIHPNKGTHEAIEALGLLKRAYPQLAEVRLQIVGTCNVKGYQAKLEELVAQYKLEKQVDFVGFVSNPSIFYQNSVALLVCSKKEGMGRVTAEAMLGSCVVIAKKSGANIELITEGETGFFYESVSDLALKMVEVLENKEKCEQIAAKAFDFAKRHFLIENYAAAVFEVLENYQKNSTI
ncbi:glycosyltransferase family 4 protein [Hugenholtzia roseola]|uniref:glycosyltransferase family 4 protein n=1 Tax=Hugenholtzia roseola TaxID=1002 RepID=UPI000420A3C1|nr:glycosyltransferase family 4 protein [Hugenholtzia roseola]